MKNRFLVFFWIVVCVFAACSEHKTERYKQLESVDRLYRQNETDSAMFLLDSTGASQITDGEKALYNILAIRIYGTKKFSSKLDSMLNFSEWYFKSVDDTIHLAETYIFKGDGFFLFKNQYDSCAYYLELGKQLANIAKTDDYLLSQIYWYQIFLHSVTGDTQQMKHDAEMQTYHAEKSGNKRQAAYAALNTVTTLKYANETDKLDLRIQAALNWSKYLRPNDIVYIYNIYGEMVIDDKPETAKDNFNKALAIQPDSKLTLTNLARLYLKQGQIKEAEEICENCSDSIWTEDKIKILTILADCKIASNNLNEAIKIQKNIISEKDSVINRIQKNISVNTKLSVPIKETNERNNKWIIYVCICLLSISTAILTVFVIIQRNKIKELGKKHNSILPHPQEEYFHEIMEGNNDKNMSQWNKKIQQDFIEYIRNLHPEIINQIESEYKPLTPTLMIFQILTKFKEPKDIQNLMCITESSYYSNISRIKTKKINPDN